MNPISRTLDLHCPVQFSRLLRECPLGSRKSVNESAVRVRPPADYTLSLKTVSLSPPESIFLEQLARTILSRRKECDSKPKEVAKLVVIAYRQLNEMVNNYLGVALPIGSASTTVQITFQILSDGQNSCAAVKVRVMISRSQFNRS